MNEPRRAIAPVIMGIAFAALLLLALAYLTKRRNAELAAYPELSLVSPEANAAVDSPLVIVFRSSRPLQLTASGWGITSLHLHAWVNGVQYMPAASDIRPQQDQTYRWTLSGPQRGSEQELHLGWADAMHRPLMEGATEPISVTIQ